VIDIVSTFYYLGQLNLRYTRQSYLCIFQEDPFTRFWEKQK